MAHIESYDKLKVRCPPLGGEVTFIYCRSVNQGLPCRNIINCWAERIEIGKFLQENFSTQDLIKCLSIEPKTKLERILELINKTKGKTNSSD